MPSTPPLLDGRTLLALGFGLSEVPDDDTQRVVAAGLDAGCRLVDGAALDTGERTVTHPDDLQ